MKYVINDIQSYCFSEMDEKAYETHIKGLIHIINNLNWTIEEFAEKCTKNLYKIIDEM